MKLRGLTGKIYFLQNLVKPSQYKDSLPNVLADVCRQVALMQRFTRFTFSTLWSQNCQLRHLFKVINLTTFPTASGTFENSIKGQLAARELPRNQALLEIYYGSGGATGHGKDLKIRNAAFLFTLSLPLCLCVFEASHDLCVATTVKNLKKRVN